MRAPIALAVAAAAVGDPAGVLGALERASDPKAALLLLRDGFDMLSEDLAEERFYARHPRPLLAGAGGLAGAHPHPAGDDGAGLLTAQASGHEMDYQSSGVDIDAGNEVVRRIRSLAKGTFTPGVLSEIGSFGGLFSLASLGAPDAVLVASADGVGTKLKVAFDSGVHDTVGEDLVNHCVNDILVQGAEPLFFLDYLATGKLSPDVAVAIVGGHGPRLPGQRLRAARRRDRGDAGLLPAAASTTWPASSSAPCGATG